MLRILAVDDEVPALEELTYLLRSDARVGDVEAVQDGAEALLALDRSLAEGRPFDALFLDIRMPGLDGTAVARVASRFADPPCVVFVTAHDDRAVEAFSLRALDYVLKPIHRDRLAEAVRRVVEDTAGGADTDHDPDAGPPPAQSADEVIPVELGGVTRFVRRSEVAFVEAHGDYARLHTADGSHLVRVALAALEERWAAAGFVRVHRSHLVAAHHVRELRIESGRAFVVVGDALLPVSRRHSRAVRDVLARRPAARPGPPTPEPPTPEPDGAP